MRGEPDHCALGASPVKGRAAEGKNCDYRVSMALSPRSVSKAWKAQVGLGEELVRLTSKKTQKGRLGLSLPSSQ